YYLKHINPHGLWACAKGSDDGPEVLSVTGSYPLKKSFGSHDKGCTTGNIPNVTYGDVSSQTVNTSGQNHRVTYSTVPSVCSAYSCGVSNGPSSATSTVNSQPAP